MSALHRAAPPNDTTDPDDLAAALSWHDGDPIATIRTLLDDCRQLRERLAVAEISMSIGFTRGWRPSNETPLREGSAAEN